MIKIVADATTGTHHPLQPIGTRFPDIISILPKNAKSGEEPVPLILLSLKTCWLDGSEGLYLTSQGQPPAARVASR